MESANITSFFKNNARRIPSAKGILVVIFYPCRGGGTKTRPFTADVLPMVQIGYTVDPE